MDYNGMAVLAAWKKFVNKGILEATHVRPEIARSWIRCREHGIDPWSVNFDKMHEEELSLRRAKYNRLIEAAWVVLQYLATLFNCNSSLSDMDGFVFELVTTLTVYSRTLGTFVLENLAGTGNLPLAMCEKKPIRVDGFEHYRAVSQNYSGVSVPLNIPNPKMGAILNINDPFMSLPDETLDIAIAAGKLIEKLCGPRQQVFTYLSSASFFDEIIQVKNRPVVVVDQDGMILTANDAGRQIVTEYDNYPYSGQSLGEYLKDRKDLSFLLNEAYPAGDGRAIAFKNTKGRKALKLSLLRSRSIRLQNGMVHIILIFENLNAKSEEDAFDFVGRKADAEVDYIGISAAWKEVDNLVHKIAGHKSNVLLLGATGTGKEVVARAIHRLSGRKGEFVAINCGAIPRELLSSELFGYEGGAFTGAHVSGAAGKFEYANGGTLFLDEIGEMPVDMQVALLRVLQEQAVTRIGSNKQKSFDVRIIAATNQDIEQLVREKRFRADLRYRLSVIEIQLPLLRDRKEDIPLLAQHFNEELCTALCIPYMPLSKAVEQFLVQHDWPGNVRELKNVMEKTLILANGKEITTEDFPAYLQELPPKKDSRANYENDGEHRTSDLSAAGPGFLPKKSAEPLTGRQRKELREKEQIFTLIEKNQGNLSRVAKEMNISRNTLYRKIHNYRIKIKVSAQQEEK